MNQKKGHLRDIHRGFVLTISTLLLLSLGSPSCFLRSVRVSSQASQCLLVELIRELPLHLLDLAGAGVVPQRPCHLLVGHGLAVPLASAPQLRQALLVLGGELKGARGGLDPPDAAAHGRRLEHLKQELEQPLLPLSR